MQFSKSDHAKLTMLTGRIGDVVGNFKDAFKDSNEVTKMQARLLALHLGLKKTNASSSSKIVDLIANPAKLDQELNNVYGQALDLAMKAAKITVDSGTGMPQSAFLDSTIDQGVPVFGNLMVAMKLINPEQKNAFLCLQAYSRCLLRQASKVKLNRPWIANEKNDLVKQAQELQHLSDIILSTQSNTQETQYALDELQPHVISGLKQTLKLKAIQALPAQVKVYLNFDFLKSSHLQNVVNQIADPTVQNTAQSYLNTLSKDTTHAATLS